MLDPMGLAQVLAETTNGQSNFYVPGLAEYSGSNWQYFAPDRLGSVRQIVGPAGQLLLTQSFDPFGNVFEQGGAGQSIFGYTDEQVDANGLVYLRARYYDPRVGRFFTEDTIVPDPFNSQSWNQYNYVVNNPLKYTDPSGHSFNPICIHCEFEIDVSDWPDWLKKTAGLLTGVTIGGSYHPEKDALVGPTPVEAYNDALINMFPGGLAASKSSKGLGKLFRGINPRFPPNSKVINVMDNLIIHESTDCSEIADKLLKASDFEGIILRVEPNKRGFLNLLEYGRRASGMYYHEVFTDGRYVYDPRLSSSPIPKGDWEKLIRGLNPDGVSIKPK